MHPNPVYHDVNTAKNHRLCAATQFWCASATATDGIDSSHYPFLLKRRGDQVDFASGPIKFRLRGR